MVVCRPQVKCWRRCGHPCYSSASFVHARAPVKCGCADLRSGKMRRNTADISADVMGKMRMWQCGYVTNERMPIAYLLCTFALDILLCVLGSP